MPEVTWTPEQAAAITAEKNTLLVANAGTGKTTTVVGKVLWQLGLDTGSDQDSGEPIAPCAAPCELSEIAAITFTDKAAYDLKKKLREAIEASERGDELRWQVDRAYIGTIHGFCGALLRENALRFGIEPTFGVLDENQSTAELDRIIHDTILESLQAGEESTETLLLEMRRLRGYQRARGVVDYVRDAMRDLRWHAQRYEGWSADGHLDIDQLRALVADFDDTDEPPLARCDALLHLAAVALQCWQEFLANENVRDFDSLILEVRDRLRSSDGVAALENIRRRYRLLIIDEFQDTDFAQRDIAFAIGHNVPRPLLFLVGDPKQSIYGFRGADIAVWNDTKEALAADGVVLDLSWNFRCAPPIVEFVNTTAAGAMAETGEALDGDLVHSRIGYAELEAGLPDTECSGLEWLLPEGDKIDEIRASQAKQVATRIRELTDTGAVVDEKTGEPRRCEFRDIALLYRARTGLEHFEAALACHGIPYYLSGAPHLAERQEVLDLVNVLRLLNNPRDDLRAFAYLRSPFVCLRDEVIARLRLTSKSAPLMRQAARFLEEDGGWSDAPEHVRLTAIEQESLQRGLQVINDLRELVYRMPLDELLEQLLQRTGYRLHFLLGDRHEEALANIDAFLRFAEGYRDLDIGTFLEVWEVRNRTDSGLPQAPLYSQEDDVVTLSTIHRAKGLEWPVVFFVGVEHQMRARTTGELWSDRALGPLLAPKADDQGPRAQELVRRKSLEDKAEESRLVYVATTRARDRLVLVGGREVANSYGAWLDAGTEPHDVEVRTITEAPIPGVAPNSIALSWLDAVDAQPPGSLITAAPEPPLTFIHSATKLMTADKDPEEWERRYRHGVIASWYFARESDGQVGVPGTARGTVIHGVLERIEEERELTRLLDETIGSLDEPEIAQLMAPGTSYREALEEEIRCVVQSDEWNWYVEGEHYRELPFAHLANVKDWRMGALDLYRPGDDALVIDFKTHEIDAGQVVKVAQGYSIQMGIYKKAASIRSETSARLFFTSPQVEVEVEG